MSVIPDVVEQRYPPNLGNMSRAPLATFADRHCPEPCNGLAVFASDYTCRPIIDCLLYVDVFLLPVEV